MRRTERVGLVGLLAAYWPFAQIVGKVMSGERLEVPPREQLPGPDTDIFAGLDDYVTLMR